jgi:hypothetical protein
VNDPRGQKKPAKQGCGVEKFLASETFVATPVRQKCPSGQARGRSA